MERPVKSKPVFLSEKQVAEAYGLNVNTLRCWRSVKRGPKYYLIGRKVRYRATDIEAFMESKPVETIDSCRVSH